MSAEPGLGDLLASFLTNLSAPVIDPVAVQRICAWELSEGVAPLLRVTPGDVFSALTYAPPEMLNLLEHAPGWMALATYVAADFGMDAPGYAPTIH